MYAIVEKGEVVKLGEISELFPNVSFPANGEYGDFVKENNLTEVVYNLDYDASKEQLVSCEPYIKDKKVYVVKIETLTADQKKENADALKQLEEIMKNAEADK